MIEVHCFLMLQIYYKELNLKLFFLKMLKGLSLELLKVAVHRATNDLSMCSSICNSIVSKVISQSRDFF